LALTSGAIFTAGVGYVFARSPKQKNSSRSSLSSTISSICTPESKKSPPFSPSALKISFQKFKLFRSKKRQKPSVISDPLVTDDDASSIYSDTASTYTMTSSAPNLPGTLSPNLESLASSTNGASLPIPSIPKQKHRRGLSMPPLDSNNNVLLYHHQRPSECWDDEFPLEEDLVVPDSLKEAQLS
ncbi:5587_t:CDS:2, partial [Acaulospora morrowiae]